MSSVLVIYLNDVEYDMNMRFLYYLPAIGSPNLPKKLEILNHNLHYIHENIGTNFSIIVNCYSDSDEVLIFLKQFEFLDNVFDHCKEGVLTELWLTNPHNNVIKSFDYVLFILDDVLIQNLDIHKLIEIKTEYNLRLISPRVINATYTYMQSFNGLTLNNALEIYCLLLTPEDFDLYASKNTVCNRWMWGVDLLFGHWKINTGVYHKHTVLHSLPSMSDFREAYKLGDEYVQQYGHNSVDELERSIDPVIKEIDI